MAPPALPVESAGETPRDRRDNGEPGNAGGPARASLQRPRLLLYGVIAVLAVSLGLARLATGPWFHIYNPRELRLIDGWPVSWEATYYTDHLPTFASGQRPGFGVSPVHYRTLLPLFLAAQLYAWAGRAFWSFAAVDLFFWVSAGVSGYHLALRLGVRPWGAALSGLLLTASPVLVSHMWCQDLHVANFASLPVGLWTAMVLVDEPRPRWQLAGGAALLLLLLSLSYQYQWLLVPLLFVLCATQPRVGVRAGAVIIAAALLLFAGATAASEALFRAAVGNPTAWPGAVVHPSRELVSQLVGATTLPQGLAAAAALLPRPAQLAALARAYHPLVLAAGLAGAALLGRRMLALLATSGAVALVSYGVYEAPWTAALGYPLVYIGAGTACAAAGTALARLAGHAPWRPGPFPSAAAAGARSGWAPCAAGLVLALVCAAVTNLDLVGLSGFALDWWRSYTPMRSRF